MWLNLISILQSKLHCRKKVTPEFHFDPAYKYISTETLKLIVNGGKLWFSRADILNDTFELSPFLMPLNWPEIVELKESNPDAANALVSGAFQQVSSSLYVTCFSQHYKDPESQLMWAHYGNNHKGCCICIDFSILKHNQTHTDPDLSPKPVKVHYVDSLLKERNSRTPKSTDLGMLIGATKGKVWEYEKEVRLIIEADSFDSTKFEYLNDRKNISVDFDPCCISKVIFGLKSSHHDIEEVVKSFCEIGHLPEFKRLDIDPLTLNVIEKDTGHRDGILAHNNLL